MGVRGRRLLGVSVILGVALATGFGWLISAAGNDAVRLSIERHVTDAMAGGRLEVGRLRTNMGTRLILEDVRIRAEDGHDVVAIGRLDLQWRAWSLLSGVVRVDRARVDGLVVDLYSSPDGSLDLLMLFGVLPAEEDEPAPPWGGLPIDLDLQDLAIRGGRVRFSGEDGVAVSLTAVQLAATVTGSGKTIDVADLAVGGHLVQPGPTVFGATGGVVYGGETLSLDGLVLRLPGTSASIEGVLAGLTGEVSADVHVGFSPLDLGAIDPFLPSLELAGAWEGTLSAAGPLSALALDAQLSGVDGARGAASLVGSIDLTDGAVPWNAVLELDSFFLEDALPIVGGPLELDGALDASGHGTTWPEGLVIEGAWTDDDETPLDVFGVPIRSSSGNLAIRNGVLVMQGLDVTAVAGTARGGGELDLVEGDLDLVLEGPLALAMLADLGIEGLGGTGSYTATLSGDVFDEGVPLDVRGFVSLHPFTWGDRVRAEKLQGPYRAHVEAGETDVWLDLVGTGVDAYGLTGNTLTLSDLTVRYGSAGLAVDGVARLPVASYTDNIRLEEVSAPFTATQAAGGDQPLVVDVDVAVGPQEVYGLLGTDGTIGVAMVDDQVALDVDLSYDGSPFIVTTGRVGLGDLSVDLDQLFIGPTARQRWEAEGGLSLRVVDGGVADARLRLVEPQLGTLVVMGDVATAGALDGRVELRGFRLDVFAELFPDLADGLAGRLDAVVSLDGLASVPKIDGTLSVTDLYRPDTVRWLDAAGRFSIADDRLELSLDSQVGGRPLASVTGFVPIDSNLASPELVQSGHTDLELALHAGPLLRLEQLIPGQELPVGAASARLRLRGDLADPDVDLTGVAELELAGLSDLGRVEVDAHRVAGELRATVDLYEGHRPLILADGRAATRLHEVTAWLFGAGAEPDFTDFRVIADDLDLRAALDAVPLKTLASLAGGGIDVEGTLDGVVTASGASDTPKLGVDLLAVGRLGSLPLDSRWSLVPGDFGYELSGRVGPEGLPWFLAEGYAPVRVDLRTDMVNWGTGDWDVRLGGVGVPLAALAAADLGLSHLDGALGVGGTLTGPLFRPNPDLRLTIEGGTVGYRPFGVVYRDLVLGATIKPSPDATAEGPARLLVDLDRLRAHTSPSRRSRASQMEVKSELRMDGEVILEGGVPVDTTARIDLKNAWVMATDDIVLRAKGGVEVDGVWPQLVVDGKVEIEQGEFALNTADLFDATGFSVDSDITVHRKRSSLAAVVSVSEEEELSLLEQIALTLDVQLGRNTSTRITMPILDDLGSLGASLTRADVSARLGGAVDVSMRRGVPAVVGEVELLSGDVKVLASQFDVTEGTLSFLGVDYANPSLDIAAAMTVSAGQVDLKVSGTAVDPEVSFSSDAYPDETTIFTILLTGQAPEDLDSQQGVAALKAASELLLSGVLGGVRLGSLTVDGDGTIHVGIPIGKSVYAETTILPTVFVGDPTVQVEAEWSILPRLVLTGGYAHPEAWGFFSWEHRF